ncbi:MAG: methionine adenosyltransferase [Desulfovibrionaceae bacterium]
MIPKQGKILFTSESVTEGHPDKVADQISDAILDALLEQDPMSRVACETLVTTGMAFIAGEINTTGYADFPSIVRNTIKNIGYDSSTMGFDWETCAVMSSVDKQSSDISQGVDKQNPETQGAGDQGMMFGYACSETPTLMPAPIYWAHLLSKRLTDVRKEGIVDFLRPDGKTQLSFEYENGIPKRVHNIVISSQHAPHIKHTTIKEAIIEEVIKKVLPEEFIKDKPEILINATGNFVIGGPVGDCGLTGRKIIQDTYGGAGYHGGGAFSGKDASKVDRSGAYMGRYIAKNIVATGLVPKCEVQVAYCIGVAEPVSLFVTSHNTSEIPDEILTKIVKEIFDLRPYFIIQHLDLNKAIYSKTTCYGHFGREIPELTWEKCDLADTVKQALLKH